MWRVTLKGLLSHRVRLVLTTLSVVLGVAFVSGTYVLTDTMSAVFHDLVRGGAETIDVLVRSATVGGLDAMESLDAQPQPLPESTLDDVRAVDGVARAEGIIQGYALIVRPDGKAITPMGPPTLGAAWSTWGDRTVEEGGRPPAGPTDVAIDATTAARNGLNVGDRVNIVFSDTPPRPFTIVGLSTATRAEGENLAGATLAEFDPATAQDVLDLGGQFTAISVAVDAGTDPQTVVNRIEATVPGDVDAITSAEYADELTANIDESLSFLTIIFGVFAAIALVVGAFIIANTFSITVLQRTREFALLRSLGASRRQVVASVVGEAAIVGLMASVLGVVAGLGLATGLNALLRVAGMDMPSGTLVLRPRTVVVGLTVGLVITVVSSLLPARRAAGIHPMAALRDVGVHAYRPSRRRVAGGVIAGVAAVVLVAVAAFGHPDRSGLMLGAGAVLALAALAATGPLLTRPVLQVLGGSGAHLGTVGRIARSNSMRTPRRTWTTASALTVGLALVSSVAVIGASMKASASAALEGIVRADVIVSASNAMTGGGVPPVLAGQLATLPEVGGVSALSRGSGRIGDASASMLAVDPTQWDKVAETTFTQGSILDLAGVGNVAVDADLARERGYAVGNVLDAVFPASGPTTLRVGAIFEPDDLVSGWLTSNTTLQQLVPQATDAAVLVARAEGVDADAVLAAVETMAADYPSVNVQDQAQYRDSIAGQVDRLLALVTALLGMALFIAVLGIMNTLALSIHERTHEIGLLRAVGMTRGQVRRMIRWEAVTVALLGAFVGLVLGVLFGWLTTRVFADQGLTAFVMPYGQLVGAVVLAALAGVLAAVLPARRAAQLERPAGGHGGVTAPAGQGHAPVTSTWNRASPSVSPAPVTGSNAPMVPGACSSMSPAAAAASRSGMQAHDRAIVSLARYEDLDAEVVVPGHGRPYRGAPSRAVAAARTDLERLRR